MNIPAYTSPTLCIGRTFHAENSTASSDIFANDIPTKPINVNKFSFKYTVVKNSKDVKDLLDLSGELSLKVKANIIKVEGVGDYIKDAKKEEGTTTLLAVMKCTTVIETINGRVEPVHNPVGGATHYVRSVTYGAELVAMLKFKSTSDARVKNVRGRAEGNLDLLIVNMGLKGELEKLAAQCESASDLEVSCYCTNLPNKLPVTIDGLLKLIETFPSTLREINMGRGIPIAYELLPITDVIPIARAHLQDRVEAFELDEMEDRFDDLRSALDLANTYLQNAKEENDGEHDDVRKFINEAKRVERVFRKAISALGKPEERQQLEAGQEAYENALGGLIADGKFVQRWKKIYSTKKPITSIKLPVGRALSLVLLGKTGNGKSETGNRILGRDCFKVSPDAKAVTKECEYGVREDERFIDVIDTPGVLDTTSIGWGELARNPIAYWKQNKKLQNEVLQEIARIFAMTPNGFDSFVLVMKYGCRFFSEDEQALKLLQTLLGREAHKNMILVLTHGDDAKRIANKQKTNVDAVIKTYLAGLPAWVQTFRAEIGERVFLFDNVLHPDTQPKEYKEQLAQFIKLVDDMTSGRERFVHKLTKTSSVILEQQIEESLDESGISAQLEKLERQEKQLQLAESEKAALRTELKRLEGKRSKMVQQTTQAQKRTGGKATEPIKEEIKSSDGCYPGSATVADIHGRPRRIDSLSVGDEVHAMTNKGIRLEPVIVFVHRQPDVMQEFLKITTLKKKTLKITKDHLLFVEKKGQAAAIPAKNVNIGDTVYVRGGQGAVEKDAVQSISRIFEKGVYAPVTLSGTILVNDVHTSCYVDVLSHEWCHRAMGVARAVHHVSPWMLQWLCGVGKENGIPGWCRLAQKMLTLKT